MRAVTIKEAKAKLNELIEAATRGEDVVLLRGSRHVAAIIPITEADLDLRVSLSDAQAERLWAGLEADRTAGRTRILQDQEAAVGHLRRKPSRAPKAPAKRRLSRAR